MRFQQMTGSSDVIKHDNEGGLSGDGEQKEQLIKEENKIS
jgi:hypothetical protein